MKKMLSIKCKLLKKCIHSEVKWEILFSHPIIPTIKKKMADMFFWKQNLKPLLKIKQKTEIFLTYWCKKVPSNYLPPTKRPNNFDNLVSDNASLRKLHKTSFIVVHCHINVMWCQHPVTLWHQHVQFQDSNISFIHVCVIWMHII